MSDLIKKIRELKAKRNAVILVHNYQIPELYDIADFIGDSLDLSKKAAEAKGDVIVFCGVHFMAETAAILNPGKTVLIPDKNSGCPMANMIHEKQLLEMKKEHPGAVVVTYVNSTAKIKALSDICCTSANALKVVSSIPASKKIIFTPDKNLGFYVSKKLNREMILWNGYCPSHVRIVPEQIKLMREKHPGAIVISHPECRWDVIEASDHVASTTGILNFAKENPAKTMIIGTEIGMINRLKREVPGKEFIPVSEFADCPNMKLNTLEKVLWSLRDNEDIVTVDEDTRVKAEASIRRMLEIV